jgi:hypothetical protein
VKSRAHRALRILKRYFSAADANLPTKDQQLQFTDGELFIGIYYNDQDSLVQRVVFSSHALYFHIIEEEAVRVPYSTIVSVSVVRDKLSVDGLYLELKDESLLFVPFDGRKGSTRDAFCVLIFLRHVIEDLHCANQHD